MRGQAMLEQLFTVALGMAFVGVIFAFVYLMSIDSVRAAQAKDVVETVAKTSDFVYSLGPGSRNSFNVMMPDGIRQTNIVGNTVLIKVSLSSGDSDIFSQSAYNMTGSLGESPGLQLITVSCCDPTGSIIVNSTGG